MAAQGTLRATLPSVRAAGNPYVWQRRQLITSFLASLLMCSGIALSIASLDARVLAPSILGAAGVSLALHLMLWRSGDKPVVPVVSASALSALGMAHLLANHGAAVYLEAYLGVLEGRLNALYHAYLPLPPLVVQDAPTLLAESGAAGATALVMGMLLGVLVWVVTSGHRLLVGGLTCGAALLLTVGAALPLSPLAPALTLVSLLLLWIVSATKINPTMRTLLPALGLVALPVVAGMALSLPYRALPAVDAVRTGAVRAAEALRFGTDTLPQGRLDAAAGLTRGSEERLTLTYDAPPSHDLYLRGFVGAHLEEGAWQPLAYGSYEGEWKGMYPWLAGEGFAPALQRAELDSYLAQKGEPAPAALDVTVVATGANRKYVYLPAAARSVERARVVEGRDGAELSAEGFGARSYRLRIDDVDEAAEAAATPTWTTAEAQASGYPQAESVYRSFAAEQYGGQDGATSAFASELFFSGDGWTEEDGASLASVISRVRAVLETYAVYAEEPPAAPAQQDFLTWFLAEAHEGNAAYFATAAVEALRARGFAARYAEGYLATAEDLQTAKDGTLTLTSKNAHAWAEVYVDGVGWAPVEVTPGFYQQHYTIDGVIEVEERPDAGADGQGQGVLEGSENLPATPLDGLLPFAQGAARPLVLLVALLAGLAALALLWLELRRQLLLRRRAAACASDDQGVSVPALYDEAMRLLQAGGVRIDPARPLGAKQEVLAAYATFDAYDYERFVQIAQRFSFGGKTLRPNEMRTLRRFVQKLAAGQHPPQGLRQRLARRYA